MGRQRDRGTESFVTVREAADALGVKVQAIYNRIHVDPPTIPAEKHVDTSTKRSSYRIPRDWLEQEVQSRAHAASVADVRSTVEELNAQGIERILDAVRAIFAEADARVIEAVVGAIREQEQEVTGRLDELSKMFKDARDTERAYQQDNLELARENRDLQRQTLELLSRVEAAEHERAEYGYKERRSFWRRLLGD